MCIELLGRSDQDLQHFCKSFDPSRRYAHSAEDGRRRQALHATRRVPPTSLRSKAATVAPTIKPLLLRILSRRYDGFAEDLDVRNLAKSL